MAESANQTIIKPAVIVDASGNSWSLVATASNGNQVVKNSQIDTTTANVVRLVYANHLVYQQNKAGGWWFYQNSGWVGAANPIVAPTPVPTPVPPHPAPTPVPPISVVPPHPAPTPAPVAPPVAPIVVPIPAKTSLTSNTGLLTDATGAVWTLVSSATSGLQAAVNGKVDTLTANITLLLYFSSVIYQQNSAGGWWSWSGGWQSASDPRIPAPPTPTAANSVTVNLANLTGATVGKELYGVAMSTSNMNFGGSFNDPNWITAVANMKFGMWRMQAESMMGSIFSGWGAQPNWGVLDPLIRNINTAFPNAILMWTGGWLPGYFNYSNGPDQQACADQFVQLANHFKANNVHISYWDVFNEPDAGSTPGSSSSAVAATSAAVFNALKQVDSTYQFGGPCTTYPNSGSYAQDLVNAYPNLDFISAHAYPSGGTNPGPGATYSEGISVGQNISSANNFNGKTYKYSLNEYNVDYNCQDSDQQTMVGAMYVALVTAVGAQNGMWSSAVWEIAQGDGTCSIVSNSNQFHPNAYFLSQAGQIMPGKIVSASTNASNITTMATKTSSGFAVQLINTGGNANVAINVSGMTMPATVTRWELSNAHPNGISTSMSSSNLNNVAIPGEGIVIVHT